jgi:hypothetical protein
VNGTQAAIKIIILLKNLSTVLSSLWRRNGKLEGSVSQILLPYVAALIVIHLLPTHLENVEVLYKK